MKFGAVPSQQIDEFGINGFSDSGDETPPTIIQLPPYDLDLVADDTTLLPPPPQRTAQASFTASGSGTAKASFFDAGPVIQHRPFAVVISLVHFVAETWALNCNEATSLKLPSLEFGV
ncbi:hypothetical protein [Burkholderia glumae]|uniref:hypothetical protein n=1 Tax=Burkholderia glumae TaxID=337 RepID=UPI0012FB6434|nr:hypothetical protein [Burkholderia glumae]